MNKLSIALLTTLCLGLTACSKMPKECEESWEKLESLSKQMGLSEDQIKEQKKQFEEEISKKPKDEAIQICKTQTSFLGLVGK
ncbi:hypothetical protein B9T33_03965 [Acinetobacter sp. ANC 5054]|uniref:hypothetical protein n=1 Tax=Acinetobacter sp. ANC 5054 TaxID=1977877 RepID=UPI000A333594|nr:hypothetical protein [Acinetobacter sp. ANC 5054]OTG82615.1 hypothetical protein B9T33_03965 [Acinetobacter sp. ANC 5054]